MATRDYNNMPTIHWHGEATAFKVKAQIMHEEPVILVMDASFDMTVDGAACGCQRDDAQDILCNCDPAVTFAALGDANNMPELDVIASAAAEASQVVDLDAAGSRMIIHD